MAHKHAYTIARKNIETEKEGINLLLSQNKKFILPDNDQRKSLLEYLNIPLSYVRAFDMMYLNTPQPDDVITIIDPTQVTLIELKTTKKKLVSNPKGFFFGATKNEFALAEMLGEKYKFCFVCLHPDCKSYKLLTLKELNELIRNKRTQYQINL
jgi:hypothetical protein